MLNILSVLICFKEGIVCENYGSISGTQFLLKKACQKFLQFILIKRFKLLLISAVSTRTMTLSQTRVFHNFKRMIQEISSPFHVLLSDLQVIQTMVSVIQTRWLHQPVIQFQIELPVSQRTSQSRSKLASLIRHQSTAAGSWSEQFHFCKKWLHKLLPLPLISESLTA